ncbi:MAG: gamma-glutamyl-gamma-aminobutyrate hydrolase family protein [Chloroflexota bacterium]|nr:gamma-glutamyl-gamma-aminobutyrate hydrolase family protein [Chloroflexota bacterium]
MTVTPSPRIGITTRTNERPYQNRWFRDYWWAVVWAGGEPVVLTPETADLAPDEQIARLDGLFLPGGGDIHPRFYNEPLQGSDPDDIHIDRDELELPLARAALQAGIPILGVCRGLQVLNIAAGGSLLQHVEGHKSPEESVRYHDVDVTSGSLLAKVLGLDGHFVTNTYHHQAVTMDTLAPAFLPSASTTGEPLLIEALETGEEGWVLAVQWHPERFFELHEVHRRLFKEFVAVAEAGR